MGRAEAGERGDEERAEAEAGERGEVITPDNGSIMARWNGTKNDAKLRQKNEKSKYLFTKRRKILIVSCKKKSKKSPKMRFFSLVSNKGSFNICIFEKFFVPL